MKWIVFFLVCGCSSPHFSSVRRECGVASKVSAMAESHNAGKKEIRIIKHTFGQRVHTTKFDE